MRHKVYVESSFRANIRVFQQHSQGGMSMDFQGANIHGGDFRAITNQTIQNGEFAVRSILNPQKLRTVGFNRIGI